MRRYEISPLLDKKLRKIIKKDKELYEATMKKVEEILTCENLDHYKNLRKPLQAFKRVHVKSSFIMLFSEKEGKIIFTDIDHHDYIYS